MPSLIDDGGLVTTRGGTVNAAGGAVTIIIPAGAMSGPAPVTVAPATTPPTLPAFTNGVVATGDNISVDDVGGLRRIVRHGGLKRVGHLHHRGLDQVPEGLGQGKGSIWGAVRKRACLTDLGADPVRRSARTIASVHAPLYPTCPARSPAGSPPWSGHCP